MVNDCWRYLYLDGLYNSELSPNKSSDRPVKKNRKSSFAYVSYDRCLPD